MEFGKKLELLRKQRGMTQEELSASLGVSRQAVSRWENGSAMPDVKNIVQLSGVLNVSTDCLLKDGAEETEPCPPEAPLTAAAEEKPHRAVSGIWGIASAALVILILLILSSVCPAVICDPPQGEVRTVVATGFTAFLTLHNIKWLFILCCILITAGLLLYIFRKKPGE